MTKSTFQQKKVQPQKPQKSKLEKWMAYVVLVIWILASMYFGIAALLKNKLDTDLIGPSGKEMSVLQDGVHIDEEKKIVVDREIKSLEYFFPWFNDIEDMEFALLGSFALGSLGGAIRLVRKLTRKKKNLEDIKYMHELFLSGCIGLVITAMSYCFYTDPPITLSFLCLLAGIYYKTVFTRIKKIIIEKIPT